MFLVFCVGLEEETAWARFSALREEAIGIYICGERRQSGGGALSADLRDRGGRDADGSEGSHEECLLIDTSILEWARVKFF